jgi:EamA domain-containing membrane protein RarD
LWSILEKENLNMMTFSCPLLLLLVWVDSTHGFTIKSTLNGMMPMAGPITTTTLSMNIEKVQTKENIRVGVIGMFFFKN